MVKIKQSFSIYLWTIPILFLSGLKVYYDSTLNSCNGLVQGFVTLFLFLILLVLSIIFLTRQVYKTIKITENRKPRILSGLVVVVAVIIALQGKTDGKNDVLATVF